MIVHSGLNIHGGHYYSFIKDMAGQWWYCNDQKISKVEDPQRVLKQTAYLLFYRKTTFDVQRKELRVQTKLGKRKRVEVKSPRSAQENIEEDDSEEEKKRVFSEGEELDPKSETDESMMTMFHMMPKGFKSQGSSALPTG